MLFFCKLFAYYGLGDDFNAQSDGESRFVKIEQFIWNQDRIEHIARHAVTPFEVEDVCFGLALVLKAKSEGSNPAYYVLGQTQAGRYLFCVVLQFPGRKGYPVTARPMTEKEMRRYRQWRNR